MQTKCKRDCLSGVRLVALNVEPGDVVVLADGREALVVARVETYGVGPFAGLLEFAVAPTSLTSDESII